MAAVVADGPWLALHLFLAGGLVLAISGVSVMLTVTWSAAPAPADIAVIAQRSCLAIGVVGVALGHELDLGSAVLVPAGALAIGGLVLLAGILALTARRGVQRRYGPAVLAYLLALGAGIGGMTLGIIQAAGTPTAGLRAAHVTLNVFGLVGLVVYGTLPFFASTVGRARMAPHASRTGLVASVLWQAAAVLTAVLGLSLEIDVVASAGFGAYAVGLGVVLWLLPKPTRRQLDWAGPRLVGLWIGVLWWLVAVVAIIIDSARGGGFFDRRWLLVLVVGGYAQILWGSLAYLLPVLRGGGPEQLSGGFAVTRSWFGLACGNVATVSFAVGMPTVAVAGIVAWSFDTGVRAVRVRLGARLERDTAERGGAGTEGTSG